MALMEGVKVLDVLERSDKALIAEWRSCGEWGITVLTPSCVVVT